MTKSIEIVVPRKGFSTGKRKVQINALGYSGTACQTATEAFERVLGTRQDVEVKPEMYAVEQGVERVSEG